MLNDSEFSKICRLSKLNIDDSEKESFIKKLNGLFEWIEQLTDIDVSDVELHASDSVAQISTIERSDEVENLQSRESILSNTKSKKFDMFAVPKVVE